MSSVIVITGASSGFGALAARALANAGGGTPPYLAPYFAAKAGMDALAVSYAGELARWGIETTIVVPGAFTKGTSHFATPVHPRIASAWPNTRKDRPATCPRSRARASPIWSHPTRT